MPQFQTDKEKHTKYYLTKLKDILAELREEDNPKKKIQPYMAKDTRMSAGIELNGENQLAHLHIHFCSELEKDSMKKTIYRNHIHHPKDKRAKGNQIWSFVPEYDIDSNKFWRYPFKECLYEDLPVKKFHQYLGIDKEEYLTLNKIAVEQKRIGDQVEAKKQDRKAVLTWWEKIEIHLDNLETIPEVYKQTYFCLLDFYIQNDKPPDHSQIQKYSYLYLLKKNKLSNEEYYNIHNR